MSEHLLRVFGAEIALGQLVVSIDLATPVVDIFVRVPLLPMRQVATMVWEHLTTFCEPQHQE